MNDICMTTKLPCIKCNPGPCEYRAYNTIHKMTATINKAADEMVLGTVKDIVTEAGIVHDYEINQKFVLAAVETYQKSLRGELAEQKHGQWEQCFEDFRKQIEGDKCSVCGFEHYGTSISHYNYCPNCGADMRGEADGDKK